MAKGQFFSFMPLYSIQAWGRFYGYYPFGYAYPGCPTTSGNAVYQRRRTSHGTIVIKEVYSTPANPRSDTQQQNRLKFSDAIDAWQALSDEEKETWDQMVYPRQMSGYNRFIRNYMVNQPAPTMPDHLLKEDGYHLLKEDDWKIKLE